MAQLKQTKKQEESAAGETLFFKRTTWRGRHFNYECRMCAFATLDAMTMAGHLRAAHGVEGTVEAATATLAETPGAPIILVQDGEV